MKRIRYGIDTIGNRSAVLIHLRSHGELWDNFLDILIAWGTLKYWLSQLMRSNVT